MTMMGHNSQGVTDANIEIGERKADLSRVLRKSRETAATTRQDLIDIALALSALDAATGDDGFTDEEIKRDRLVKPEDLIAGKVERALARWAARGGGGFSTLKPENDVLSRVLRDLRDLPGFEKIRTFGSLHNKFERATKKDIREALKGVDADEALDAIVKRDSDLFKEKTILGWIDDAKLALTDDYLAAQDRKKAISMAAKAITNGADPATFDAVFQSALDAIVMERAAAKAEKERMEEWKKLKPNQRYLLDKVNRRVAQEGGPEEASDDD